MSDPFHVHTAYVTLRNMTDLHQQWMYRIARFIGIKTREMERIAFLLKKSCQEVSQVIEHCKLTDGERKELIRQLLASEEILLGRKLDQ